MVCPGSNGFFSAALRFWHSARLPGCTLLFASRQDGKRKGAEVTDEVKQRKLEHINVALGQNIAVAQRANWQDIAFVHQALPEVDLDEIDTSVAFLGHTLRYPIFISSLTGGHPDVTHINQNLARAAEQYGLALGVGSQRAAIVNPDLASSYTITRESAPHAFLIANIGAPQLIPQARHAPFTIEQIQRDRKSTRL